MRKGRTFVAFSLLVAVPIILALLYAGATQWWAWMLTVPTWIWKVAAWAVALFYLLRVSLVVVDHELENELKELKPWLRIKDFFNTVYAVIDSDIVAAFASFRRVSYRTAQAFFLCFLIWGAVCANAWYEDAKLAMTSLKAQVNAAIANSEAKLATKSQLVTQLSEENANLKAQVEAALQTAADATRGKQQVSGTLHKVTGRP